MLNQSLEAIAIQDKSKFSAMHAAFDVAVSEIADTGVFSTKTQVDIENTLSDQIRKIFNLNSLIILGKSDGEAYCLVQPINTRHIFTPVEYKKILDSDSHNVNNRVTEELLETGKSGTVDLSTGRVGGVFSEMEVYVYLDVQSMVAKYSVSDGNLMAVFLHEIGHIITYIIYCANTASINQLLMAYSAEAIDQATFTRKLKYTYIKPDKTISTRLQKLADSSNRLLFNWEMSKLLYDHHAAHSTHSIYDNTAAESLADNFTARCGYGAELIDGLVKLYVGKKKKTVTAVYTDNLSLSTLHIFKSAFTSKVAGPSPIKIIAVIIALFIAAILAFKLAISHAASTIVPDESNERYGILRYDSLYQRAKRVREQVVHNLRGQRNPKILEMILSELDTIDQFMPDKSMWDKFGPVARWVESYLSSDETKQIVFEQSLANLVNNPLLISSANALVKLEKKV